MSVNMDRDPIGNSDPAGPYGCGTATFWRKCDSSQPLRRQQLEDLSTVTRNDICTNCCGEGEPDGGVWTG
eukprot:10296429-Heterocapsa_arctica.AAC.1